MPLVSVPGSVQRRFNIQANDRNPFCEILRFHVQFDSVVRGLKHDWFAIFDERSGSDTDFSDRQANSLATNVRFRPLADISVHLFATTDVQRFAGDVLGIIACEPGNRCSRILLQSGTSQRYAITHVCEKFIHRFSL